jgi:arylsulfatase A-like enzyme
VPQCNRIYQHSNCLRYLTGQNPTLAAIVQLAGYRTFATGV